VRVEFQATLVDTRRARRVSSIVASAEAVAGANQRGAVLEAFERATDESVQVVAAWLRDTQPTAAD
jgi:hypothetical protein